MSSYTLYYFPGAASMPVHWLLIELGVDYSLEKIDLRKDEQHSPQYLAINPAGKVPTLLIDGTPCYGSVALLIGLTDRYPDAKFAPLPTDKARIPWLALLQYLTTTVQPTLGQWFYAERQLPDQADRLRAMAQEQLDTAWQRLDDQLSDGRPYMMGEQFTVLDMFAMTLMRWSRRLPKPANTWPNLARYMAHLSQRVGFVRVAEIEQWED